MNLIEAAKKYQHGLTILKDWLGADGVAVDNATAQGRADVCLVCPENVSGFMLTETVAEAIKAHIALKNNIGLRVVGEKSLHTCEVCHCANRLQIHCPPAYLYKYTTPEETEKYPVHCWKRKGL